MKKIFTIILIFSLTITQTYALGFAINGIDEFRTAEDKKFTKELLKGFDTRCKNVKESDIPTIFVPGLAASWYSQEGFKEHRVKRWIPDPMTHVYDTLFYTFKQNGYTLRDVFYDDEFTLRIEGNPKGSLYLFGYDWKRDNKITATLLTQLIGLIYKKYEEENGCNIGKVNIISHSMGGLVARSMLSFEIAKIPL